MATQNNAEMLLYVGTYTDGESEGIYVYRMDTSSGALKPAGKPAVLDNPTFLTIHPRRRHLYAVSEVAEFEGQPSGGVSSFSIAPGTGELTFLNRRPTGGTVSCHVIVDQSEQFVLLANYGSGSVSVFALEDDGQLGERTDFVQHQGSSIAERQEGPHAHSIIADPANRYAFAADLGLDKIMVYRLDLTQGKLIANDEPWVELKPGAGPRHFVFHPNGRYAYVINELDSTVTGFTYGAANGSLNEIQTLSALPDDFEGTSTCADIHVSPSGMFLYGSNRGHDSIAIFAIDQNTGRLTPVGHALTQGKKPRNFAIDPTGTFLLAANQDSDNIVSFRIDRETGELDPTGHVAEVPMPACLKLMPVS